MGPSNNATRGEPPSPMRGHHPKTSNPPTPNRARINSRDIPRSYSAQFGQGGDDLLPFELSRNWHTDWVERGEFVWVYIGSVATVYVLTHACMETMEYRPLFWAWTVTNFLHLLVSIIYVHWLKGSVFDDQGEMAALTLWEQLEGRPKTVPVKRALTIVPTLLCYAACHFSGYDYNVCLANIVMWAINLFAKLPLMNGVRIFGINRTAGIDDFRDKDL